MARSAPPAPRGRARAAMSPPVPVGAPGTWTGGRGESPPGHFPVLASPAGGGYLPRSLLPRAAPPSPRSPRAASRRRAAPAHDLPSGAAATTLIRRAPLEITTVGGLLASQVLSRPSGGGLGVPTETSSRPESWDAARVRMSRSSTLLPSRHAASPTETRS